MSDGMRSDRDQRMFRQGLDILPVEVKRFFIGQVKPWIQPGHSFEHVFLGTGSEGLEAAAAVVVNGFLLFIGKCRDNIGGRQTDFPGIGNESGEPDFVREFPCGKIGCNEEGGGNVMLW